MVAEELQTYIIYAFPAFVTVSTWLVVWALISSVREDEGQEEAVAPAEIEEEKQDAAPGKGIAVEPEAAERVPEALSRKLSKTRKGFFTRLRDVFGNKSALDADMVEELEALLVSSDIGVATSRALIERIENRLKEDENFDETALLDLLKAEITRVLRDVESEKKSGAIVAERQADGPLVVMLVGVNGAGKTTTAAKLAAQWKDKGQSVMMVAGDTFRAAAVQQLRFWGEQLGVPVVSGEENARPATVVFEAMEKAVRDSTDVVIIDTAGRLHTRSNLMKELTSLKSVIKKHQESAPHEILLVVDGASGQNAIQQASEFHSATDLTGVIVTKLDGTSRGGTVVAIAREIGIPVRYIGVGEGKEDLRVFNTDDFVKAFFDPAGLTLDRETLSANAQKRVHRRKRRQA